MRLISAGAGVDLAINIIAIKEGEGLGWFLGIRMKAREDQKESQGKNKDQ
jgi:hypothetical protein